MVLVEKIGVMQKYHLTRSRQSPPSSFLSRTSQHGMTLVIIRLKANHLRLRCVEPKIQ